MDTALALAALINANGPLAVQTTKRLMREEIGPDRPDHVLEVTAPGVRRARTPSRVRRRSPRSGHRSGREVTWVCSTDGS